MAASAATTAMVVVVDVVEAAMADDVSRPPHTAASLERLEVDVDVGPHTSADALLADVEAAITEMHLRLCVPRSGAALAAGHALPPLGAIESTMAGTLNTCQTATTFSQQYTAAVAQLVMMKAMSTGTTPILSLCTGEESVRAAALRFGDTLTWSVMPRSVEQQLDAPAERTGSALAAAGHEAAASRMLSRGEAALMAVDDGVAAAADSVTSADGRQQRVTKNSSVGSRADSTSGPGAALSTTKPLQDNHHSSVPAPVTHGDSQDAKAAAAQRTHEASATAAAVAVEAAPSTTSPPVVALQDVDVVSFRRLQAHQALVLSREEDNSQGAYNSSIVVGGGVAATTEEQQRLQPTLPWAAIAAAVHTEIARMQSEHVLTGLSEGEENAEAALPATRARLRAAWLSSVREETQACQAEAMELRRAAEKAQVWRAAVKDALREEVAALEREVSQNGAVLTEREVLRRRVELLEAQVAQAKAEELQLLQSPSPHHGSARPAQANEEMPSKSAHDTTASSAASVHEEDARDTARDDTVKRESDSSPRRLMSPVSSSSSSSSPSRLDESDAPPPPPTDPPPASVASSNPVHSKMPEKMGTLGSQQQERSGRRWAGRREPLTEAGTAKHQRAPPPQPQPPRKAEGRSRSRLSIERSFLSPSLQDEVRAALADDSDSSSAATSSTSSPSSSSTCLLDAHPAHHRAAARVMASAEERNAPIQRRRRYQRKEPFNRNDASQLMSSAASTECASASHFSTNPAITPLRTATSTAFSPAPVPPGVYGVREGRVLYTSEATRPRRSPSSGIQAPAFSGLYDSGYHASVRGEATADRHSAAAAAPHRSAVRKAAVHCSHQQFDTPSTAVEELREVTAALRRHIREPQPDPQEGQRLLQQVRALRRDIELDEAAAAVAKKRDARVQRGVGSGAVSFIDPGEVTASPPLMRREERAAAVAPPSSLLYDTEPTKRPGGLYRY